MGKVWEVGQWSITRAASKVKTRAAFRGRKIVTITSTGRLGSIVLLILHRRFRFLDRYLHLAPVTTLFRVIDLHHSDY